MVLSLTFLNLSETFFLDITVFRMVLSSTKNAFNQALSEKLEDNYLGDITNHASMHFAIYVFLCICVFLHNRE